MIHYCHNCRHFRPLPDNAHCAWCLDHFDTARTITVGTLPDGKPKTMPHPLPLPGDPPDELSTLDQMYASLGWEMTSRAL